MDIYAVIQEQKAVSAYFPCKQMMCLALHDSMICKRCSFECDLGKYSTRSMNKV